MISDLIDAALDLELPTRESLLEARDSMSPTGYVLEFRTICLGLPRRSGKTTYIKENACGDDLVVVHNYASADQVYRDFEACPVVSSPEVLRNIEIRTLWIDEPWLVEIPISEVVRKLRKMNLNLTVDRIIAIGTAR